MRLTMTIPVVLALVACAAPAEEPSGLRRLADSIRATPDELKFKRIPWVTDVFTAFELAKAENRPVFLYLVLGDALEDC